MTKFSDWKLIPADRKCDLSPTAEVQVMWRDEDVGYAEEENTIEPVSMCLSKDGCWFPHIFGFRRVIEPVEEVETYSAWVEGRHIYTASSPANKPNGTVTLTKVDGKPVKLVWERH